jgi:hypothetical protein
MKCDCLCHIHYSCPGGLCNCSETERQTSLIFGEKELVIDSLTDNEDCSEEYNQEVSIKGLGYIGVLSYDHKGKVSLYIEVSPVFEEKLAEEIKTSLGLDSLTTLLYNRDFS